jgi:AcrR family transcriptional regulator
MARRSDHSREQLQELAVQAGLEIIKQDGFANFSARKVASNIGYTVGTLYNIFGSYDDFILHINAATLDNWFEAMQATLQINDGQQPLLVLAQFYIKYSKANHHQWLALFEHHMQGDRDVPSWYFAKMMRFFSVVERLLAQYLIDELSIKNATQVLWAGIHGIAILSLSGKLDLVGSDAPENLAINFVENYLRGLRID